MSVIFACLRLTDMTISMIGVRLVFTLTKVLRGVGIGFFGKPPSPQFRALDPDDPVV